MRVLVTGGAGYIGSHALVELLGQGHGALVVDSFANSSPKARDERLVGDIAASKDGAFGHGPIESRRQIVDDDDRPAPVEQGQHRVAADVAGTAGDQHGKAKIGHSRS